MATRRAMRTRGEREMEKESVWAWVVWARSGLVLILDGMNGPGN
jgi:hypothetical protein